MHLSKPLFCGWPLTKTEVQKELQSYWPFRHEIAITDRIAMKDKRIIVPVSLKGSIKRDAPKSHGHREDKVAGM